MNKFITNLDTWSNETIKKSFLGNLISFLINKIRFLQLSAQSLIFSIVVLFTSLSLPQFANDRFGKGIIILLCFLVFLLNLFSTKSLSIQFNALDFLILLFLLTAIVSTFSSYFFKESVVGLLKYITFFSFYLIIKTSLLNSSKNNFLNLWSFLFFCAVVTSTIGIYQYTIGVEPLATWEDPTYENIHTRVYSTLGNPNLLAGYLLAILPVGLVLPFAMKANTFKKILFLIGNILILLCLIFTGSRGAYLGLITGGLFSLLIFIFYLINYKDPINRISTTIIFSIGIIALILTLTFMFPVLGERLSTIFTLREHSSNSYRINVWLACLQMLKDNWLIGIGPGNNTFRLAYGLYMKSGFDALAAYNIFLEFAVEVGIIGSFIFLIIFLVSFLKLHYLFWQKNSILALGIFISLICLFTQGMVDTVYFRPQVFIPFWFLLASIDRIESED